MAYNFVLTNISQTISVRQVEFCRWIDFVLKGCMSTLSPSEVGAILAIITTLLIRSTWKSIESRKAKKYNKAPFLL